jgi:hypothetical protein
MVRYDNLSTLSVPPCYLGGSLVENGRRVSDTDAQQGFMYIHTRGIKWDDHVTILHGNRTYVCLKGCFRGNVCLPIYIGRHQTVGNPGFLHSTRAVILWYGTSLYNKGNSCM